MDFDTLELVPFVTADLYRNSLVLIGEKSDGKKTPAKQSPALPEIQSSVLPADASRRSTISEQSIAPAFSYLGGFQKQVSIVVSEHFHPHISDIDLDFLTKMLTACKLSLNDVAIINIVNNPRSGQLWELMPAKVMLFFDVDQGAVGLSFRRPHFEIQQWADAKFMSAPALELFSTGDEATLQALKRNLWTSLQKLFLNK